VSSIDRNHIDDAVAVSCIIIADTVNVPVIDVVTIIIGVTIVISCF